MKTTSLFIAALVVIATAAFGKEEPTKGLAVVPVKGSEVFKVIYKGESTGRVRLNLYDTDGQLVFTESINGTDGFIRPLNFKGLEAGEYTIELVDATGKKSEKVSYNKAVATKNVHISKVNDQSGKFLVAVTVPVSEEITINIFDEKSNLVHSEVKTVNGGYAQVFSVKAVAGTITFEVSDKSGVVKTATF